MGANNAPSGNFKVVGDDKPIIGKVKVVGDDVVENDDLDYEDLFLDIAEREGSGDKVTSVKTAHYGVTASAAKAVGKEFSADMTKDQSREIGGLYIKHLNKKFKDKVVGWSGIPKEVREAVLDTAYNTGPQILNWTGVIDGLSELDYEKAAKNLLDTATADGKSLKGLAKRRAEQYNLIVGEDKITEVEQEEDGTLNYLDADGGVVFSYKPSGGRHKKSSVGKITVVEVKDEEYASMADGWYRDPDTGEKFEIKKGKRL